MKKVLIPAAVVILGAVTTMTAGLIGKSRKGCYESKYNKGDVYYENK